MLANCASRFAGSDTTAISFRAIFYYLMKNPDTLKKVHEEIDAACTAGALSAPIKYSETTTKLPYTCAAIKEAMRMYPSVGLSMPRHAPEEGIVLAGVLIPGGYRIGMNPAVVHYNKDVFGQDAECYRPERWMEEEKKRKVMDKHLLIFGAGTKTCIGKNVSGTLPKWVQTSATDNTRSLWSNFIHSFPRSCDIMIYTWRIFAHGRQSIVGSISRLAWT
jgi:cytochrome P450